MQPAVSFQTNKIKDVKLDERVLYLYLYKNIIQKCVIDIATNILTLRNILI
jgi:hypothetical protein